MFKRPLIVAILVLALGSGGLVYRFLSVTPQDRRSYDELMAEGSSSDAPAKQKVKQQREQVSKDLFFTEGHQRRQLHIEGKSAELKLERDRDSTILVETIHPMTCVLQESLNPLGNEQNIVWMDATQAHLNYHTQTLYAENISIARYKLSGDKLPLDKPSDTPLLEGVAQIAELSMDGKAPKVSVQQFKGQLLLDAKEKTMMDLEANEGNYSSNIFLFCGNVRAEHPLGTLRAQKAELLPKDDGKGFGKTLLQNQVDIALKHGGRLYCDFAELDNSTKQALFKSPPEKGEVIYTDSLLDRKGNKVPIVFKSIELRMDLSPGEGERKLRLMHMLAEHHVTLIYNHEMTLSADHADYTFHKNPDKITAPFSGIIVLTSQSEQGLCQLTNLQGDYVRADRMELNTLESSANLFNPQGSLQTQRENAVSAPIAFSADKMVWKQGLDSLVLQKNAVVTDNEYGTITTDDTLTINRATSPEGKKILKSIVSTGNTVLTHIEQTKGMTHTLWSHGKMILDHEKFNIQFTTTSGGEQVAFEDAYGDIKADRANLTYRVEGERIVPQNLSLDGNLKIVNRHTSSEQLEKTVQQYALADHAQYNFQTKEMVLTARPKKRVLFYDKANLFEVSAPGLKIKRDAITQKESITGQGDVRFNLIEHELEQIKNHFRFES